MAAISNLLTYNIIEGDDVQIEWTLTDVTTGDPYDFTGTTKCWFTLKKNPDDSDSNALIALNSIDDTSYLKYGPSPGPGPGKIYVWMSDTLTANLADYNYTYYDLQVLQNGLIATLVTGKIQFVKQITEAIS